MVFLMKKPENVLEIREIEVIWSDASHIYAGGGLLEGAHLVTTDIGAPLNGMALRTAEIQGDKLKSDKTGQRSELGSATQKDSRK